MFPVTGNLHQKIPTNCIVEDRRIFLNLNSSDSARLHRTISLMYVGARHLEFGITFHKVT